MKYKYDLLTIMLEMQEKFQWKFGFNPSLKDISQALANEAGEMWKAGGGKWWSNKVYTRDEKVMEVIDAIHFVLTACVNLNMTAEEIFEVYSKKLAENYRRQFQKEGYEG